MTVLLVGGGAREHALAWKLKQEEPEMDLIAAPGNPGIAAIARCVPVAATDVGALRDLAVSHRAELVVVGPEAPLAAGLADALEAARVPVFGPTKAAAEIETSKAFAKRLMLDAGVPTARAERHTDAAAAKRSARDFGAPVVIKASGLAAGKGVVVCGSIDEADRAIDRMLVENAFGDAGAEILVEEFMEGEELSVMAITDGTAVLPLVPAQDHKRLLDGDQGPNTGGMGAYAPVTHIAPNRLLKGIVEDIMLPTLGALRDQDRTFRGVLYAGVMLTKDGPKVVEFNCRLGDPETQVILPLTDAPLYEVMTMIAVGGYLPVVPSAVLHGAAVTTVLAAAGYPEKPRTGDPISIPADEDGVLVFHAGTARGANGQLVTAGGRVLAITAVADTMRQARERSLGFAERVEFAGKHFRTDIGWRELDRHARAP